MICCTCLYSGVEKAHTSVVGPLDIISCHTDNIYSSLSNAVLGYQGVQAA